MDIASSTKPDGDQEKQSLRALFEAVMRADLNLVETKLKNLTSRYSSGHSSPEEDELKDVILQIHQDFPGDIGIFCVFLLNYVKMEPGEALFLGAGEPHAYISGGRFGRSNYTSCSHAFL